VTGAWWQYILVFLAANFLAFVSTPAAIAIALRRGVLDKPGGHKSRNSPVPYLGGLAIIVAFTFSMLIPVLNIDSWEVTRDFLLVFGVALVLAVIGLLDDLKGLSAGFRFLVEIVAGIVLWEIGVGVSFFGSTWIDATITVAWVVGITNAFNLLDNMDGLSAGIAAVASFSFFTIAAANGQYIVAGFAIALTGCALGFLKHNFHPAKVYMGDSGALFFGFLISFLGLKLELTDVSGKISFLIPIVVCSVAVLDTTVVSIARIAHGLSPFQGGRDHLSHRLAKAGLPIPVAVSILYLLAGTAGTIAFVIARVDNTSAYLLTGLVAIILVFLGVVAYQVPVYENSARNLYKVVRIENGEANTA
jgi:UDP-GlcNAc:undecaprenyl-phosphate GlcNAc-1-phosphate transferase